MTSLNPHALHFRRVFTYRSILYVDWIVTLKFFLYIFHLLSVLYASHLHQLLKWKCPPGNSNYSITYVLLVIGLAKTHFHKPQTRLPKFFQRWWSDKCLKNVKISRYSLEHSFMIFTCHHHQFKIRNSVHINIKLNIKCYANQIS